MSRRMFLVSGLSVGAALLLTPQASLLAGLPEERSLVPEVSTSIQLIRRVQQELQKQGYDPGTIDGKMGPRTESALKRYQTEHELPATGKINEKTLETIGLRVK